MRALATLIVAGSLIGSAVGSATRVHSGLYGHVTRGPITPVCVAEQPCTEPATGATLKFLRNGNLVAQARVKDDGGYRVSLPPGVYTVSAQSRRALDPTTARVRSGRFARADFAIDTGIR